jgi:hypothetical protein
MPPPVPEPKGTEEVTVSCCCSALILVLTAIQKLLRLIRRFFNPAWIVSALAQDLGYAG